MKDRGEFSIVNLCLGEGIPHDHMLKVEQGFPRGWQEAVDWGSYPRGDDRLVEKVGLIHPNLAKPLFHIWNILLMDMEAKGVSRYWRPFDYILYNGWKVFLKVMGTRGFQVYLLEM